MKKIAYSALILMACSSNNENQAITPEKDYEVATVYELGICNTNRQSEVVFVLNEHHYYICNSGNWEIKQDTHYSSSTSNQQTGIYNSSSSSFSNQVDIDDNHIIDSRDGHIYRITTIGSQVWMAQNLNYETDNSLCKGDVIIGDYTLIDGCASGRYYRYYTTNLDDKTIDMKYGYSEKDPCPSGWHISTIDDWTTLLETVGIIGSTDLDIQERTAALRATTGWDWTNSSLKDMPQKYLATDLYGFSVIAAGWGRELNYNSSQVDFLGEGTKAVFWMGLGTGKCIKIDRDQGVIGIVKTSLSNSTYTWSPGGFNECTTKAGVAEALSIRCVKD